EVVDRQPEASALAEAEPEDSGRKSLECDVVLCRPNPSTQRWIVGEHVERERIGGGDVLRISGQGGPSEGTASFAEQWPDIFRHKSRNRKRVVNAAFLCLGADVVAVIECDGASLLERNHRADVLRHRRD